MLSPRRSDAPAPWPRAVLRPGPVAAACCGHRGDPDKHRYVLTTLEVTPETGRTQLSASEQQRPTPPVTVTKDRVLSWTVTVASRPPPTSRVVSFRQDFLCAPRAFATLFYFFAGSKVPHLGPFSLLPYVSEPEPRGAGWALQTGTSSRSGCGWDHSQGLAGCVLRRRGRCPAEPLPSPLGPHSLQSLFSTPGLLSCLSATHGPALLAVALGVSPAAPQAIPKPPPRCSQGLF